MEEKNTDLKTRSVCSEVESAGRKNIRELFRSCPIPEHELLAQLGLFVNRQTLTRWLYMHDLYKQIVPLHGVIMEFGCRWGQNLALFESFRGMYEPYNHMRKIVGFDTFSGFASVHEKDGKSENVTKGGYSVTDGYEKYLEKILQYHEQESPLSHVRKYELRKGDAVVTSKKYLQDNPQTIIALAYFDMDLYEPTKECLQIIKPHLMRGSIIGFDELVDPSWPGETLAFKEVLGANNYKVLRSPIHSSTSYIIFE